MIRPVILSLFLLACALPARAETAFLTFDPDHTHIMFNVMHLGLARTYGEFEKFEGRAVLDTDRPENVIVEVTIDVTSLNSGLKARDDNLMGGSWFDADRYPAMGFKATGLERTGETTGILTGNVTLLDVTQPVTLDVTFNGKASDPFSPRKTRWGFSATGALKRSDFGMNFGLSFVADEINLIIETELLQTAD